MRGSNIIELLTFILYPEEYDEENPDENIPEGFVDFLYCLRKIELESIAMGLKCACYICT